MNSNVWLYIKHKALVEAENYVPHVNQVETEPLKCQKCTAMHEATIANSNDALLQVIFYFIFFPIDIKRKKMQSMKLNFFRLQKYVLFGLNMFLKKKIL